MSSVPRLEWVVAQLDLRPTDVVLEIGCGPGVAAVIVLRHLTTGSYTGLDRSAAMVADGGRRCRADVDAGRARFVQSNLADAELGPQRFDCMFAARVREMCRRAELSIALAMLRPGAALHLAFDSPDDERTRELVATTIRHAREVGFAEVHATEARIGTSTVVDVRACAP